MSPIPLVLRAANLLSLNRLRAPRDLLDRVCPVRDEALLPHNSRQRKRECWPADKAAADSHNARDARRETDSSVSMGERGGGLLLRKTSSPNSETRREDRRLHAGTNADNQLPVGRIARTNVLAVALRNSRNALAVGAAFFVGQKIAWERVNVVRPLISPCRPK